jgi:hypothetical protein
MACGCGEGLLAKAPPSPCSPRAACAEGVARAAHAEICAACPRGGCCWQHASPSCSRGRAWDSKKWRKWLTLLSSAFGQSYPVFAMQLNDVPEPIDSPDGSKLWNLYWHPMSWRGGLAWPGWATRRLRWPFPARRRRLRQPSPAGRVWRQGIYGLRCPGRD